MIAIIDYGMGNLGSVRRALTELGSESFFARTPDEAQGADRFILPGVGSFADGMRNLTDAGWPEALRRAVWEEGRPLLGICLGMQLLARTGSEGGLSNGLELVDGEVVHLQEIGCTNRIPHVGWNSIRFGESSSLFEGIPPETDFYFVHSFGYRGLPAKALLATTDYGGHLVAAVGARNVFGTQFHPEKSSKAGIRVLQNFIRTMPC